MSDDNAASENKQQESEDKSGFTPPESQEALDRIIQERVARSAEKVEERVRKDYEGWVSPDDAKKLHDDLAQKQEQITAYERESAAAEAGLPKGFGQRLQGSNVQEWKNDAQALAGELLAGANVPREEVQEEQSPGKSSPGYQPRERRGVGGGDPAWADSYAGKTPQELVKDIPRF